MAQTQHVCHTIGKFWTISMHLRLVCFYLEIRGMLLSWKACNRVFKSIHTVSRKWNYSLSSTVASFKFSQKIVLPSYDFLSFHGNWLITFFDFSHTNTIFLLINGGFFQRKGSKWWLWGLTPVDSDDEFRGGFLKCPTHSLSGLNWPDHTQPTQPN